MRRIGGPPITAETIVVCATVAGILVAGCGGKGSREESKRAGRPDTTADAGASAKGRAPSPPGVSGATPSALPSPARDYGYDRAGEYVRSLQERVDKVSHRLDDIERRIRATEAPETAEMDARLETLRAIAEDITTRGVDAENSATEKDWPAWQESLEREMGNLDHGTARLDSMVTAVRRSP